jgi:predicted nucleotidyltransferase
VTYLILFGSVARGDAHDRSDVDLAVGGNLDARDLLQLELDLERALGRPTQLVTVSRAAPALRARIFRDGIVLWERDRAARVRDHARAIVEYLDYQPVEAIFLSRVRARVLGDVRNGR